MVASSISITSKPWRRMFCTTPAICSDSITDSCMASPSCWIRSRKRGFILPSGMDCPLFASRGCKLGYGQYLSTLLLTRGLGNWVASQNVGNQFRLGAAKLQMRMNPNEFGKKLGIGVRVAGRIAKQRAQEAARAKDATQQPPGSASQGSVTSPTQNARAVYEPVLRSVPNTR